MNHEISQRKKALKHKRKIQKELIKKNLENLNLLIKNNEKYKTNQETMIIGKNNNTGFEVGDKNNNKLEHSWYFSLFFFNIKIKI